MSMYTRHSLRGRTLGLALAAGATLAFGIASASASVLVSDNFDNATNNTTIAGRAPDTGTHPWAVAGSNGGVIQTAVNSGDGEAFTTLNGNGHEEAAVQFDPGSPGVYGQYTLSATIRSVDAAYIALGFVSDGGFFAGNKPALMATVRPDGRVYLRGFGADELAPHATIADFDSSIDHTFVLIYNAVANTAIVKIDDAAVFSNVALLDGGNSYTLPLQYGGFYFRNPVAVSPNAHSGATVDDFKITATPEPASGALALLGVGGLTLLRRKRCH